MQLTWPQKPIPVIKTGFPWIMAMLCLGIGFVFRLLDIVCLDGAWKVYDCNPLQNFSNGMSALRNLFVLLLLVLPLFATLHRQKTDAAKTAASLNAFCFLCWGGLYLISSLWWLVQWVATEISSGFWAHVYVRARQAAWATRMNMIPRVIFFLAVGTVLLLMGLGFVRTGQLLFVAGVLGVAGSTCLFFINGPVSFLTADAQSIFRLSVGLRFVCISAVPLFVGLACMPVKQPSASLK